MKKKKIFLYKGIGGLKMVCKFNMLWIVNKIKLILYILK